jgi:hypothetical protein
MAVAAVRYATGARIRRVKVSPRPPARASKDADKPVIILSRKLLKAVRQQPATNGRLTARR